MGVGYDRLTPEGKKFYAELEKLKKLRVVAGYQQGQAVSEDGVDLADIALWNELGTASAPSRPFLRKSVDENEEKIISFGQLQAKRLTQGATAQEVLTALGVMQKGLVQEKIVDGDFEPNAPSTIKKKGSDKPLIDTGDMRRSVNFAITEKEGGG